MKKYFISLLFIYIFCYSNYAVELKYIFKTNDISYSETKSEYNTFVNNKLINNTNLFELSKQIIISNNKNTKIKIIKNIINESDKTNQLKKSQSRTYMFYKSNKGKTKGLNSVLGLHDFPMFPEYDLNPGDSWELPANYVMPLLNTMSGINFDVSVSYRFIGYAKNSDDVILISGNLVFVKDKNHDLLNSINIYKINGFSNFLIKFNITEGRIISIYETFDYSYILSDSTIIELVGKSTTKYRKPEDLHIVKIDDIENTKIDKEDDKSIKITLLNIKFKADSMILLDEEKKRLDKIAEIILKEYPNNKILVIGHTASTGNPDAEFKLSEDRSREVLKYLVKRHNFDSTKISYEGKGSKEPIGDNSTDQGKSKNRRVEIIILPE